MIGGVPAESVGIVIRDKTAIFYYRHVLHFQSVLRMLWSDCFQDKPVCLIWNDKCFALPMILSYIWILMDGLYVY